LKSRAGKAVHQRVLQTLFKIKERLMVTTPRQMAGKKVAFREGRILAEEHPELADDWKNGATQRELATQYLPSISKVMGEGIICNALRRLVRKKERRLIARAHLQKSTSATGKITKRSKIGIFAFSRKQHREASQKGIRQALLVWGVTTYDGEVKLTEFGEMTEREYIEELACLKKRDKRYTWRFIANLANAIFNNSRSVNSVQVNFTRRQYAKK
jgi:hypothetical protein